MLTMTAMHFTEYLFAGQLQHCDIHRKSSLTIPNDLLCIQTLDFRLFCLYLLLIYI